MRVQPAGSDNIKTVFLLKLGFTIFEIIGGLFTNSLAIISDALHDLGDTISLGLSWYSDRYAQQGENTKYPYSYKHSSNLGALVKIIILIIGGVIILFEAVPRIINPEPLDAVGMITLAITGIIISGLAVLHARDGRAFTNQGVTWHLLEDFLAWSTIFIVSFVVLFTDLYILDTMLSILITLYIIYSVSRNFKKAASIFQ